MNEKESVISLRGVSVYHSQTPWSRSSRKRGEEVLSDINLTVKEGEMVYFIGRVGSGKSSLLRTLYAELPLLEGEGEIAGFNLRTLRRKDIQQLRRSIGIVFQDCQLLTDRNAFQNLHYVMRATGWRDEVKIRQRIETVLGVVGLQHKAYKMPYELSGGEQQRLTIARALVNNPKIILADEPTGNLDPASSDEIMELFRRITRDGCAIIMSTHNISNLELFPARTIRFSKGHIEELDVKQLFG